MTFYRISPRKSTSASFARDAVFAEFQPKHARAIDYDGFIDRLPHQRPPTIYEIGGRK